MTTNGSDDDEFTPRPAFGVAHHDNAEPCRILANFTLTLQAMVVEIAKMVDPLGKPGWHRIVDGMLDTAARIREAVK